MASKQVIVMRKFSNLRIGKYCAQAGHAATGALLSLAKHETNSNSLVISLDNSFVSEWLLGRFTKIAVYVNSEQELLDLHTKAKNVGLPAALIQDAGLTEFKGIPTYTCLGIGPGDSSLIDSVTGHLPLF